MARIHTQLLQDCLLLGGFELSHLLLMQDANYPWFILVPDREGVSEIFQLSNEDQIQLTKESAVLSRVLAEQFTADKLNIAALGNIVPQLHIHHVVRYRHDPAWPAPVWGKLPAQPFKDSHLQSVIAKIKPSLEGDVALFI